MAMKKISKSSIIFTCVGIVVLLAICYGVFVFIQHVNGTSPAQIEARQRVNEAADQATKAMEESGQWYQDQLSQPVTITTEDGETVTYGTQTATCINSSSEM